MRLYRLTLGTSNLQPRYNICPTTTIDAIVSTMATRFNSNALGACAGVVV